MKKIESLGEYEVGYDSLLSVSDSSLMDFFARLLKPFD